MPVLRRVEAQNVTEAVVQQVLDLVRDLPPESKLPSERSLVQRMGVSRACVREAMRTLAAVGVVRIRPGKGAYVAGPSVKLDRPQDWFPWVIAHRDEIVKMLEVRDALSSKCAALAALRATPEEVRDIEANVRLAETVVSGEGGFDTQELAHADLEFHDLVAKASHNELLAEMTRSVYRILAENRTVVFRFVARAALSLQQHRSILEAIKRREPEQAALLMSNHVNSILRSIAAMTGEGGPAAEAGPQGLQSENP